MRGFPRHFETKDDFKNAMELYPEQTRAALATLYADRYKWAKGKKLKSADDGITDATHYVYTDTTDEKPRYYQMEKVVDENAEVYRMGFTDKEIKKMINP